MFTSQITQYVNISIFPGVLRDNAGHAVALKWSMEAIYGMKPGDVFWAARYVHILVVLTFFLCTNAVLSIVSIIK